MCKGIKLLFLSIPLSELAGIPTQRRQMARMTNRRSAG
jgi:hypothetical protein